MVTPNVLTTCTSTFEELHGGYMVSPIDLNSYSQSTKVVVDNVVRELLASRLAYNDFYRTIRIETVRMWEERVGVKS